MNKEVFHRRGLNYYCNQDMNDFKKSNDGLFCDKCSKNIFDFREKTKYEYDLIAKDEKYICGIFYADQIGDEVEIEVKWKKPFIMFSLFISFLFSRTAIAQDSSSIQIELVDSSKLNNRNSIQPTQKKVEKYKIKESASTTNKGKKLKRRLYISKKFPFINYNRRRRHVMGCPAEYW